MKRPILILIAIALVFSFVLAQNPIPYTLELQQLHSDTTTWDATKTDLIDKMDIIPVCITLVGSQNTWANMPDGLTEMQYAYRLLYDFTNVDSLRWGFRLAAAGTDSSDLWLEYSIDQADWATLTDTLSLASAGTIYGDWMAIPSGAQGNYYVRIMGQDGDGIADPAFRVLNIQLK